MAKRLDMDETIKALREGKELSGKNGKTSKTVKTSAGQFELDSSRDRTGSFKHQLVKKIKLSSRSKLIDLFIYTSHN